MSIISPKGCRKQNDKWRKILPGSMVRRSPTRASEGCFGIQSATSRSETRCWAVFEKLLETNWPELLVKKSKSGRASVNAKKTFDQQTVDTIEARVVVARRALLRSSASTKERLVAYTYRGAALLLLLSQKCAATAQQITLPKPATQTDAPRPITST